jgi:hypothetical protein
MHLLVGAALGDPDLREYCNAKWYFSSNEKDLLKCKRRDANWNEGDVGFEADNTRAPKVGG